MPEQTVPDDSDEIVFRSNLVTQVIQSSLLQRQPIVRYEIGPARSPLTLGTLPVIVEEHVDGQLRRPRLSLVVVGGPS